LLGLGIGPDRGEREVGVATVLKEDVQLMTYAALRQRVVQGPIAMNKRELAARLRTGGNQRAVFLEPCQSLLEHARKCRVVGGRMMPMQLHLAVAVVRRIAQRGQYLFVVVVE